MVQHTRSSGRPTGEEAGSKDFLSGPPSERPRELAPLFDEVTFWSSRFGALLFRHLELHRGIRGLDVGCATGFPLIELAMVHGPSCGFVGVERWKEAARVAARKIAFHRIGTATVTTGDAKRLPYADGSFDLVVSNLGLNNFDEPASVFRECGRVTRSQGRLVLTTNPTGTLCEIYAVFRDVLERVCPESARRLAVEEARRGSPETIRELVEDAGFRVRRMFRDRFEMRFADGSAALRHGLLAWFIEGWREALDPSVEREAFSRLEKRLNALAAAPGYLSATIPMLYLEATR